MDKRKEVYLRCDDYGETAVFSKFGDNTYELTIEDSYCGGDYMGITGRFKRAWRAFFSKPIYYTGVYCSDKKRMKKFLKDCLKIVEEDNIKD